jgi:pyocin large subunit-like protein
VPFDPYDPGCRMDHFLAHGQEIGATTADEYEAMADHFMTKPKTESMHECVRRGKILCRYDSSTQEYGAMVVAGNLLTYFIPVPGAHLSPGSRPWWMHGWSTNLQYFLSRCR